MIVFETPNGSNPPTRSLTGPKHVKLHKMLEKQSALRIQQSSKKLSKYTKTAKNYQNHTKATKLAKNQAKTKQKRQNRQNITKNN